MTDLQSLSWVDRYVFNFDTDFDLERDFDFDLGITIGDVVKSLLLVSLFCDFLWIVDCFCDYFDL